MEVGTRCCASTQTENKDAAARPPYRQKRPAAAPTRKETVRTRHNAFKKIENNDRIKSKNHG